jgi:hypothetical protein
MRVGNNSCLGVSSCMYLGNVSVGSDSCQGYYSCYNMYSGVGDGSWYVLINFVLTFLLLDVLPVYSRISLLTNPSNGKSACAENAAKIGSCLCNGDYECYQNTSSKFTMNHHFVLDINLTVLSNILFVQTLISHGL